mmetsp:Transcript_16703/g.17395  ORF Transcript_16703/g.17395 Transcript_16703/m.17395 type:complete len:141 (-) Transcript_16703:62-484(-)
MLNHFDIVLCSSSAVFLVPFIQTLQVPEGTSSYNFPRIFKKLAGHILYKGDPINADEAKNAGLVSKVFEPEDFKSEAWEYVEAVAKNPLRLLVLYKKMVTKYDKERLREVNDYECKELRASWDHPDFEAIISKFVKKPKF